MNRKMLIVLVLPAGLYHRGAVLVLLVFYGKDEYEEMAAESEEEIETQTMLVAQDNDQSAATIVLSEKSQKISGIQATPLQAQRTMLRLGRSAVW